MHNKNRSPLCIGLHRIKEKHNITVEQWAEISGVSKSSIGRYLSSSLNIPSFPAVCAMLKCLDESIDDFYNCIDEKISTPEEALKLDAVPVSVVGDIPVDVPESKAEIQERIIVQVETMQAQKAAMREMQMEKEMLELRLEMAERIIEDKDATIADLKEINQRRLEALKVLCSVQ